MNKNKCSICNKYISNLYFQDHFSRCNQLKMMKENKRMNEKEKVFQKLFNFLDYELGLVDNISNNNFFIDDSKSIKFINDVKTREVEREKERKTIKYMNNVKLREMEREKEKKKKEDMLKLKLLKEKKMKKEEYLKKINEEKILRDRKMRQINETNNKKALLLKRKEQEKKQLQYKQQLEEIERQRKVRMELIKGRREEEIREKELKDKLIKERLERERLNNIKIKKMQKEKDKLNEKKNSSINLNKLKKIDITQISLDNKLNEKIKKDSNECEKKENTKNYNLKKPDNYLDENITRNLRNYSLVNLNSGQLNYNHNKFINKIFDKYTQLFAHYLKGKSVVLVGPANSIIGTNLGKTIDKFDIVIRLNKALPIPVNLKNDIGSRTDIIYNALNTTDFPGQNNLDTNFYRRNGVKFVVSPYPFSGVFYNDIINYISQYKFDLPFRTVKQSKFSAFKNQLKTRPYTGTSAIMDLLTFDIKALYITGIDFYNTPYYSQYRRIKRNKLSSLRDNSIHSAYPQMEYLLYKSLIDKRIILDKTLEKLLYNQYFKFSNNLRSIDSLSIINTNNYLFTNYINDLFKNNNFNVLIIGKDFQANLYSNFDIYFDFTNNAYNLNTNKLITCDINNNNVLANILLKKLNDKTILISNNVRRILRFLLKFLDIKQCSKKIFYIIYIIIIFKSNICITGFNFHKELSKKQKYKELLLIKFLEKYKFIKII